MRILCITDKQYNEEETAIKGIFEKYILQYCEVYSVYFTKEKQVYLRDKKFVFPYSTKHRKFIKTLMQLNFNLLDFDLIIVRNFYPIAKQLLPFHPKILFWETFPHDYRRIYEAKRDKKAIWRKSIEYKIKYYLHAKILEKCAGYITMTPQLQSQFQPQLKIPIHIIPSGIDFENCDLNAIQQNLQNIHTPLKFLYIGTIDKNRQILEIITSISHTKGDFILDIFTPSNNKETQAIAQLSQKDSRIKLYPPLSFTEMLKTIPNYDIGLGIIPNTPLYSVSSPIKAMEYASNGLIPLINDLPEYLRLFDENTAFFTTLDSNAISNTLAQILSTPPTILKAKKQALFKLAKEKMDYQIIARQTYEFLESILQTKIKEIYVTNHL